MVRFISKYTVTGGLLAFLCAFNAGAVVNLDPGATYAFVTPDGGETECHIETLVVNCDPLVPNRFSGTGFNTTAKTARAVFSPIVGTFAEANHASASLYNEVFVTGSGGVITAHISVGFNYTAQLVGAAAYSVDGELNLVLSDVTGGAPGVPVASTTLVSRDRSGDQGVTDISVGGQRVVLTGEGGSLKALLRRGHTYRVSLQATAYGAALLVGRPESDVRATLNSLHVTLDEDEAELLAIHDADIKADIAAHDVAVQAQIAQHDADIKARLQGIEDDLEEIKLLLITPQGLRPGFPNNPRAGGNATPGNPVAASQAAPAQVTPTPATTGSASRRSAWGSLFR